MATIVTGSAVGVATLLLLLLLDDIADERAARPISYSVFIQSD